MSYAVSVEAQRPLPHPFLAIAILPVKLLHSFISFPTVMFVVALAAMLFRPPDLKTFHIDRVAFAALIILVALRWLIARRRIPLFPATWPLSGLLLLGLWGALTQPYSPQAWSLLAEKWLVPFFCFHFAGAIFHDERSLRRLETFLLVVLGYLTAVSVLSLLNVRALIFPRFIVDGTIGIHIDRARGPFLQAVANGVCLNFLALCALDSYRRGRVRGMVALLLFAAVPLALLATKTRSVWIAAAVSLAYLVLFAPSQKVSRIGLALCVAALVGTGIVSVFRADSDSITERLLDRSPVDFRTEMYDAGWQMFTEKPLFGWGNELQVQPEIKKRVSGFRPEYYVFHNTFLELGAQRGLFGLSLYLWLWVSLFRLGRRDAGPCAADLPFSSPHFRLMWPGLLTVYLINASAVVMNYQFVNAVVFTIAGILACQAKDMRDEQSLQLRAVGE